MERKWSVRERMKFAKHVYCAMWGIFTSNPAMYERHRIALDRMMNGGRYDPWASE